MNKLWIKTSTGISTALVAASIFAGNVFADDKIDPCVSVKSDFSPLCKLGAGNFNKLLGNVLNFIFIMAVIAALFYLIYGGIKWLTSEGDKSSVEAARQHIIAAIVGLIIVFMSYFILNFVVSFFTGGKGLSDIQLPVLQP